MTKPLVSIIIPVFKAERFLSRCLESILNQTTEDYEVICIDDCSPDRSAEILREYVPYFHGRLHIISNKSNIGGGASRERALRQAMGKYTTFIDSDDYIAPDFLASYLSHIRKANVDVVIGGYTKDLNGRLIPHDPSRGPWCLTTYAISCAKLYKTEFLLNNGIQYSRIRCGEDIYFGMSLLYHGATYSVIPYAGYHYFYNEISTTSSMNAELHMERNIATIFDQFCNRHDLTKAASEIRHVIEYTYITNMINALIVYGRHCGAASMRERVDFFHHDLQKRFPSYRHNPYLNPMRPHGQTLKIRVSVSLFMFLERLGLDKALYQIMSCL